MKITKDLKNLLIEYVIEHPMKFKKFINKNAIDWHYLSSNTSPGAIDLIEKNIESHHSRNIVVGANRQDLNRINWYWLSENPMAMRLIEKNLDKVIWRTLSSNHSLEAINLIEKNMNLCEDINNLAYDMSVQDNKISLYNLSKNPAAIHLLEKNPDKIHWNTLSMNPEAIHLLEQNPDKIHWDFLSWNCNALNLIKENLDKVSWQAINKNENPKIVNLLSSRLDKIDWKSLSMNPAAIHLIEKKLIDTQSNDEQENTIDWNWLSSNPAAIHLLDQNEDKIHWAYLASNPSPNAVYLIEKNIMLPSSYKNDKIYWGCIYDSLDIDINFLSKNISQIFKNPAIFEINIKKLKMLIRKYKI